jgi:hypothetical protein
VTTAQSPSARPLTVAFRRLLVVYCGLGVLTGIPLFLGTAHTDRFFAWTIKPPLTAAFLGAGYWASAALNLVAARERPWARARVAVSGGLVFTSLMLLATLLHLDRFHFHSSFRVAQAVTWIWLCVYVLVPALMLVLLVYQLRASGTDEPRTAPMPPGLRLVLGVQGLAMLGVGAPLFVDPQGTASVWPWALTPLTARATGAWLAGLAVVAAHMALEADVRRVRAGLVGYAVLGGLQCVALLRYPHTPDWSRPSPWIYLLFILSVLGVGLYGAMRDRTPTEPSTLR